MKKIDIFILSFILILAFAVRLYKIDTPLADWHSWRQVDTAAVARNYTRTSVDLLHPRFDDLSSIPSGQYNPEGYRFVEFPLYNATFALLYRYFPVLSLEIYGRLVSVSFSLIVIAILYYIVRREESRIAATATALTFSFFPFFVYYSRVILPEMTALGLVMMSVFFLYIWKDSKAQVKKKLWFLLSLVCAALSILVKPTAGFYFIPLAFIFLSVYRIRIIRSPMPYVYFILTIAPLLLWRQWISAFPEGIPGFMWLFTTVNTFEGAKVIFFRPAFFRWIFFERILLLITGGYAVVFLMVGALKKPRKNYFLLSFGVAALTYLLTFQGGNVQHDYYQTMILPAVAIFMGIGVDFFLGKEKVFTSRLVNSLVVIAILVFSAGMSYERVKDYYNYSQDLVQTGNIIQTLTPQDAQIVTDRDGDTTLLYLADRKGFPATTEPLDKLKERGAKYFVTGKADVAEQVKKEFKLIFEGDNVFIFKL